MLDNDDIIIMLLISSCLFGPVLAVLFINALLYGPLAILP